MAEKLKDWLNSDYIKELQKVSSNNLLRFHFFRDECRATKLDKDIMYSPADGVIIYQKVLKDKNDNIVEIKGKDYTLDEAIDNMIDIEYPCLIIGIFMTAFDVHINRMPTGGILSHYDIGPIASYNKPMLAQEIDITENKNTTDDLRYLYNNERVLNKVYEPTLNLKYYFLQIADYDVRMIVPFESKQTRSLHQSERMGMIRWGSQCDLIIPLSKLYDFEFLQEEYTHVKGGYDPLIRIIKKQKTKTNKITINTKKSENNMYDTMIKNTNSSTSDKQYIEAEDGEFILKNSKGDIAIIPAKDKDKIQKYITDGNNNAVDEYVSRLPKYENYAKDGTTIPTSIFDYDATNITQDEFKDSRMPFYKEGKQIYPIIETSYVKSHPEKYKLLEDQLVDDNHVYPRIFYSENKPSTPDEQYGTDIGKIAVSNDTSSQGKTITFNDYRLSKYTKIK